jgi:hypothetical protein
MCPCMNEAESESGQTEVVVSCPHGQVLTRDRYAQYLAVDHTKNMVKTHRIHTFNFNVFEERTKLRLWGDHVAKTYIWSFGPIGELYIPAFEVAIVSYAALYALGYACSDCKTPKVIRLKERAKVKCGSLGCECGVEFGTIHI